MVLFLLCLSVLNFVTRFFGNIRSLSNFLPFIWYTTIAHCPPPPPHHHLNRRQSSDPGLRGRLGSALCTTTRHESPVARQYSKPLILPSTLCYQEPNTPSLGQLPTTTSILYNTITVYLIYKRETVIERRARRTRLY